MIKVVLTGALGRMAGMVAREIKSEEGISLSGAVEYPGHPGIGSEVGGARVTSELAGELERCDLLVDFSFRDATPAFLDACVAAGKGFITGTTGLPDEFMDAARKASARIPVLVSPNMSAGVNLMFRLAGEIARSLKDFDVEILEIHHNRKKDAPSGTAARLAGEIMSVRGESTMVYGRHGMVGQRSPGEIGVHSLRGGDVTGEHTVVFAGEGERVELVHRAHSRRTFARGAVKAIRFLAGSDPGLYSMQDVLGL